MVTLTFMELFLELLEDIGFTFRNASLLPHPAGELPGSGECLTPWGTHLQHPRASDETRGARGKKNQDQHSYLDLGEDRDLRRNKNTFLHQCWCHFKYEIIYSNMVPE